MSEPKLKPCPFCSGKADIEILEDDPVYFMIFCTNDDCSASACFGFKSENRKSAIEAWNRRTNGNE